MLLEEEAWWRHDIIFGVGVSTGDVVVGLVGGTGEMACLMMALKGVL